jgi:hypothetical protein
MHSLYNYLLAYENNKDLIKAYLSNKSIENYAPTTDQVDLNKSMNNVTTILGFGVGIFILIFLISLGIWIWAVVVLIKYRKELPGWAQVLGIIGVLPILPGGPILTLIAVYVGKDQK